MTIKRISKNLAQYPMRWMLFGGCAILILTGGLWFFKVSENPEHVFWAMIGDSLNARSVTVQVENANVRQVIQVDTDQKIAHSLTRIGNSSGVVEEEMLGNTSNDFLRYAKVQSATQKLNTSQLVNVWGKDSSAHLFAEVALGLDASSGGLTGITPVPIGTISHEKRQDLIDTMHSLNVYNPDFTKVQKKTENGHHVFVYEVKISPVAYVIVMKQFAVDLGLHELDNIDPNAYSSFPPLNVELAVDQFSHQLITSKQKGASTTQQYSGYDIITNQALPTKTIPIQDLIKRFSSL